MDLRLCTQADLPAVLNLFRTSVHTLCRADYTPAQLSAWRPRTRTKPPGPAAPMPDVFAGRGGR